ncbi:MAG: hypothetical protein ACR2J1_03580 [Methyloceanibacter sp.]|uniref:hypothetical protein n=1 Tax=Methyloceanibacter sp. TaxID=1965321 RepID=UPI003D9ACADA
MTMIQNKACLLASLALAAAVPATFAQGEEALIWTEKSDGNSVSLAYGSLDSAKNPVFLLSCFNEMDVVVLNIFGVIEGKRPGQALTIELSAGSETLSVAGESSIDRKTSSMFAESGEVPPEPILTVLRSPGPVTVKLGFTTKTLSDAGREAAVTQFAKDCKLD